MLDQLPPTSLSDKLSDAFYRWRGIDKWPEAEATVYSCEWHPGGRYNSGCYEVTYTYRANDEIQEGSYFEDGSASDAPYQQGDKFTVRWNPGKPARSYTANNNSEHNIPLLIFWGIIILIFIFLVFGSKTCRGCR